jgi:hypothetical protein
MGAAQSSSILSCDARWQCHILSLTFLHKSLPADAVSLILKELNPETLHSLMRTCQDFHQCGAHVCASFDETVFYDMCLAQHWSFTSLADVAVHVSPKSSGRSRSFTPCPPWLARLGDRLSKPHYHHMRDGVVAKVLDAMGPLDHRSTRFQDRTSFRRTRSVASAVALPGRRRCCALLYWRGAGLFFAHVKHKVEAGGDLIARADVQELRKLRGVQAYLYAEGWADLGHGEEHPLEHTIEHALAGRLDVS